MSGDVRGRRGDDKGVTFSAAGDDVCKKERRREGEAIVGVCG